MSAIVPSHPVRVMLHERPPLTPGTWKLARQSPDDARGIESVDAAYVALEDGQQWIAGRFGIASANGRHTPLVGFVDERGPRGDLVTGAWANAGGVHLGRFEDGRPISRSGDIVRHELMHVVFSNRVPGLARSRSVSIQAFLESWADVVAATYHREGWRLGYDTAGVANRRDLAAPALGSVMDGAGYLVAARASGTSVNVAKLGAITSAVAPRAADAFGTHGREFIGDTWIAALPGLHDRDLTRLSGLVSRATPDSAILTMAKQGQLFTPWNAAMDVIHATAQDVGGRKGSLAIERAARSVGLHISA